MSKFLVDSSFWELFPQAKIGVLLLDDLDNSGESGKEIRDLLYQSNKDAERYLVKAKFNENPLIASWRAAYQKFKTKKGARCSIEALLKRVEKENTVGCINPLVDIYNSASLRFGLPCGAEDMDSFQGDLILGITRGGDEFYLIGESENSPTLEGELCYRDDAGAVCRCFNWRDGERTMITEKTKRAFVVIECIEKEQEENQRQALELILQYSRQHLGARGRMDILDAQKPQTDLSID
ncbi:MAG: B3/4 domain-containing protein [Peptostreptococcaceae bacterium]|nr:B3/4 domain-containing protein [Peptostreptococcaceae bacterium]